MTTQLAISAESLRNVLAESNASELRQFARLCRIEYQQQWSGLDLVAQARRWAVYQQQNDVVTAIDRSIADTWTSVANQLCESRANTELLGGGWVRSLSLLTERFPSNVVHEAFIRAMLAVAQKIQPSGTAYAFSNPYRITVVPEAKLFTPTWLRTINKNSPEQMHEVFNNCKMMFQPGDYFAGYVMAWRYGADIAAHYVRALRHALPQGMFLELPLGSDRQLNELEKFVANAMHQYPDAASEYQIFSVLNGPLAAWSKWLSEVFRNNHLAEEILPPQFALTGAEASNDEIWDDEDQEYQPRHELSSFAPFARPNSSMVSMGAHT